MVIGLVHSFLPYMILTCYISLQAIDDSLMEAARSLGANGLTAFRRVTPAAQPAGPGRRRDPDLRAGDRLLHGAAHPGRQGGFMLGNVIEDQFTVVFNWPLGAALSFILLAIVLLILALCYPLLRRQSAGWQRRHERHR